MKKVVIIGGPGDKSVLAEIRIAKLQKAHPEVEIVSFDEAKELGLSQTFEFKARPELPKMFLREYDFRDFQNPRAKRRAAERKNKKKQR